MVWNLSRGEEFLPNFSLSEIKKMMVAENKAKPRLRLLIALHRKQGKSIDDIANALALPRRTVHGTLQRFSERGIKASNANEKSGRPKRLNQSQLKDLRKRLLLSPTKNGFKESFWNTRSVLSLVKKTYGVDYTPQWMWSLLYKMGFSCKKPRPTHYKSSPKDVKSFKKKLENKFLEQNENEEQHFVWTNAVSLSRRTRHEDGSFVQNQQS